MPAQLSSLPASSVSYLRADGLSMAFPDRRLFSDLSFTVSPGERACLLGENGRGKSTLLRILAGLAEPTDGTCAVPEPGLHHQLPPFPLHLSLAQVVDDAVAPLRAIPHRIEVLGERLASASSGASAPGSAEIEAEFAQLLEDAERQGVWQLDERIGLLEHGLGTQHLPRTRAAGELSGGQLSRLSLLWTLLRQPYTLLLDEPTNHLDDRGVATLVDALESWGGPVLMASHDRAFIDESATVLLDMDPAPQPAAVSSSDAPEVSPLTRFPGTYTDYLLQRRAVRERWEKQYRDEQAELKRLQRQARDSHTVGHPGAEPRTEARGAKKFYADKNATVVSRRVNDFTRRLEELKESQVRKPPAQLRFAGFGQGGAGKDRASDQGASVPRPASDAALVATEIFLAERLAPVSLAISPGGRLLIEGPNGCGKSTLLKVLAGRLEADAGAVHRVGSPRIGLLGQEVEPRDESLTAHQAYEQSLAETGVANPHSLTSWGLLEPQALAQPLSHLSAGQRRRLDLAILLAQPWDVLLLDEPTNHLSLALATELEESLPRFEGAVVVASHDCWLRERWEGEKLALRP